MCQYVAMENTPYLTQVNPGYWIYTIYKPLYGNVCSIRDKVINGAIKEGSTLAVRLRVDEVNNLWIEQVINPKLWKRTAKVIEMPSKFHNARPMLMYQAQVVSTMEPVAMSVLNEPVVRQALRDEELYA